MYKSFTAYLVGMLIATLLYSKYPVQGLWTGIAQFAYFFVLCIYLINVISPKRNYIWETGKVNISDFCWAPFFNMYNGRGNRRLRLAINFATLYMIITLVLSFALEAYGRTKG